MATSTSLTEFEEFLLPIIKNISQFLAIFLIKTLVKIRRLFGPSKIDLAARTALFVANRLSSELELIYK